MPDDFSMLMFVANQEIPEIWETEEDKRLPLIGLKKKYLAYAKGHFQGHEFLNKNTGKMIKVSGDGIREWWVKSRRRAHIISIQILGYFLENGVLAEIQPDYKGRDYIESASRFHSGCVINDELYRVILTTRKSVDDIDKLRYYSLESTEGLYNNKAATG
jgi:hypothetical protein